MKLATVRQALEPQHVVGLAIPDHKMLTGPS
jgi:hypothetical protein